jgi:hypothetical protein
MAPGPNNMRRQNNFQGKPQSNGYGQSMQQPMPQPLIHMQQQ